MLGCYSYGVQTGFADYIMSFGIKVFLLMWIVFVPIVITARLEKIIKLLEDKK